MSFSRLLTLGLGLGLGLGLFWGSPAGLHLPTAAAQTPAAKPAAAKPATGAARPAPTAAKPATPAAGVAKPGAKPPQKTAAKPPTPPGGPVKVSCAGVEGQLTLLASEADIKCNAEFEECEGKLDLVANNCTSEFQSVYKLEVFEGGRRQQVLEFDPAGITSPGGGQWKDSIPWSTPGDLEVVIYYHPPGQSSESTARGPAKVQNRAMLAAQEACTKCQGTWGRYGVNKFQGCNCKMPDAGKTCYDGDECQGYCLFRRYDVDAREEGECSETQRVTGCVGIIFKGQSKVVPHKPPPRKQATCMD